MSTNNSLYFLGAAVVGIVSAAGLFIAEHLRQERKRHVMAQDLARLDRQLLGMQQEIELLRTLQKERNAKQVKRSRRSTARSATSVASDDFKSAAGDSSDLEYFDLSDEEDVSTVSTTFEQKLQVIDDKLNSNALNDIQSSLELLQDLCLEHPEDPNLLWRIGKAHYKISSIANEKEIKTQNIERGIRACENALKLDSEISEVHKWFAILVGSRSDTQPLKEKIGDAYLFKSHLDLALKLNPTDSTLHHLLGRFTYETANLKWYERKVAATFFADPPKGTFEEALEHLDNAERLATKDWKENKLLIAKCQLAMGKFKEGVESLVKADAMEKDFNSTVDSEVKSLLEKYNTYR